MWEVHVGCISAACPIMFRIKTRIIIFNMALSTYSKLKIFLINIILGNMLKVLPCAIQFQSKLTCKYTKQRHINICSIGKNASVYIWKLFFHLLLYIRCWSQKYKCRKVQSNVSHITQHLLLCDTKNHLEYQKFVQKFDLYGKIYL